MSPRKHHSQAILARAARCETLERRMLLSLTPAGGEFPVNTYTFEFQEVPAIAMDDDGDFVVAWQSFGQEAGKYDPPDLGVYAQRYNAAGVPQGDEFHVNTTTTESQGGPAVAMDDNGDFVVVWGGFPYGIQAQRYNAAGVRQGSEFTVAPATGAHSVAMDADGDFVVAYTAGGYGFGYRIHARRYNAAGVPQGSLIQVNASTSTRKERPDVAMDDAGYVVTWESRGQDGGGLYGVYARRYDAAGAAQGGEFRVDTFTTGDQWFPAVTMDDDGNFVVAWSDFGQAGIYAQRYNELGAAQGGEFRVHASTTNAMSADIAVDSDGDFTVTWQSLEEGMGWGILARTLSAGGVAQQPEFRVNTTAASDQTEPAVAMSADGKAVIAWQGIAGPSADIFARRFVEGVPPPSHVGGEFRVNTHTTNGQDLPAAAMDDAGNLVVVWEGNGQDGGGYGIYAQRYDAAGAARGGEFRVNTYTADHQEDPAVAMDADGDFVVVWTSRYQDGDYGGIYAQRDNAAGVAQGAEFQVNTYTTNLQFRPAVAMDGDGDFVITWESNDQDGHESGIFARRYSAAGVALSGELRVNTTTVLSQFDPAIAMDTSGDFVIAWQQTDRQSDFDRDVFAQRFDGSGQPVGSEFLVHAQSFEHQFDPSIAMDDDGDFVVAWTSSDQPSPLSRGIFARRFSTAGVPQGEEFRVNTFTTGHQRRSSVMMEADGDFVIVWDSFAQQAPNSYSIYAQRYNAAGIAQAGEFRVNVTPVPTTPGDLFLGAQPAAAMDADGDFIVVWAHLGRDGSSYGVYAQRFRGVSAPAAAPAVSSSSFLFETAPHRLRFTFSDNVSASLGTDDIVLENLTTSQTIPSSDLSISYDLATNTATFTYTGSAGGFAGILPDGNYRATLIATGITNAQGVPLPANHVFNFFFLNGDANHDGRVNLADFNILATNFGQSPRNFTQGDFTYDNQVNLADFNILAGNFGTGTLWSQGNFNFDNTVNLFDFNRLAGNFGQTAALDGGAGQGLTDKELARLRRQLGELD